MSVETLSLSGLSAAEAGHAAAALLDIDSGGPDRLDRLLVVDDTSRLTEHLDVYEQVDTSHRVGAMICVTVGPRPGDGLKLELPGNLGGVQGSPVLWLSRLGGIDWALNKALMANRHPGFTPTTADRHPLIGLLSVAEMFDRVHQAFLEGMPGRVASPGLWLAGEDDESATFAGALAVAIRRVCEPGPGLDGPFPQLLPSHAGGARLAEASPLARYRGRVDELDRAAAHSLERQGRLGGLLRRGDNDAPRLAAQAGQALGDLRELVDQVLRDANVDGGLSDLTDNQLALVRNAGIEFEAAGAAVPAGRGAASAGEQTAIHRVASGAIRGGDPIPVVGERLIATEREMGRRGSAAYRPEVEARCPAAFLAGLAAPAQRVPARGGPGAARREMGLEGAVTAAGALVDLVLDVANREWSPAAVASADLVRAKAALDGSRRALAAFASDAGAGRGGTRAAKLARVADGLVPLLRDLVLRVLAGELGTPSASGPEALRVAKDRTAVLLAEWTTLVHARGVSAVPSWAAGAGWDGPAAAEDDVAAIREALLHQPRDEMWQLCGPADLGALDPDTQPLVIRFASRLTREALRALPGDEPVFTSSGSFAGILRLVPLRPGVAVSSWARAAAADPSTAGEP